MEWKGTEVEAFRHEWIVLFDANKQFDPASLRLTDQLATVKQSTNALQLASYDPERKLLFESDDFIPYLYEIPDGLLQEVMTRLQSTAGFRYAEPNFVIRLDETPNDPQFSPLWGLNNIYDTDIDAPEAWNLTTGSTNVVVGVIDTGVDYEHEDLRSNMWTNPAECPAGPGACIADQVDNDQNGYVDDFYGWDFANDDNDPSTSTAMEPMLPARSPHRETTELA